MSLEYRSALTSRCSKAAATGNTARKLFLLAALIVSLPADHIGGGNALADEVLSTIPDTVQFNRDIRPLLSDKCFACHGPDKTGQKADFSLHTFEEATVKLKSGIRPIVPGDPRASAVIDRIRHGDPAEIMPPPKTGKVLTEREIALIERWIEQGAEYERHWAYIPPQRPEVPQQYAKNAIDFFIREKLAEAGLKPSAQADRRTLIRRLSFDLTGLPPDPSDIRAFLDDRRPDAYERLVDGLLASPHFGERMALHWLDVVRYADTNGFHADFPRHVWPYRDYVIQAFNENKPFDRFTIEQIAGDLLPDAERDALIASTYNNLNKITEENGAQAKEYLFKSMSDRVVTTGTTWLGSTVGCAECHDHKFDPISQADFFALGAFFADVEDYGTWVPFENRGYDRERDFFYLGTDEEVRNIRQARTAYLDAWAADETQRNAVMSAGTLLDIGGFDDWLRTVRDTVQAGEGMWVPMAADAAQSPGFDLAVAEGAVLNRTSSAINKHATLEIGGPLDQPRLTALRVSFLSQQQESELANNGSESNAEGPVQIESLDFIVVTPDGKRREAKIDYSTFSDDVTQPFSRHARAGWIPNFDRLRETGADVPFVDKSLRHLGMRSQLRERDWVIAFEDALEVETGSRFLLRVTLLDGVHQTLPSFRLSATRMPSPGADIDKLTTLATMNPTQWTDDDRNYLRHYFVRYSPDFLARSRQFHLTARTFLGMHWRLPKTRYTTTVEPRTVRLLPRGNWMDDSGPVIEPAFLGELEVTGDRPTRLDLARWLVSRNNPLTARVFMNRLWSRFFGNGLSATLEDLGSQGEWPRHPELLDWLAVEFMDAGWDVKHMVRLIVLSDTYRQDSSKSAESKAIDSQNRFLSRQSQIRLPAEIIRDNALAVSGLLDRTIGGRGVWTYQPNGTWGALHPYRRGHDSFAVEDLYRRGIYSFWQRTDLHPSLNVFGAPTREAGVAKRPVSNTPLQALTLLNDPTYVEAARALGTKMARRAETQQGPREAISWAFERATGRQPTPDGELPLLVGFFEANRARLQTDPKEAEKLLAIGQSPRDHAVDTATLAAWSMTARAILNLHETITRP